MKHLGPRKRFSRTPARLALLQGTVAGAVRWVLDQLGNLTG